MPFGCLEQKPNRTVGWDWVTSGLNAPAVKPTCRIGMENASQAHRSVKRWLLHIVLTTRIGMPDINPRTRYRLTMTIAYRSRNKKWLAVYPSGNICTQGELGSTFSVKWAEYGLFCLLALARVVHLGNQG
jgi:hypothetical protein